MTCREKLEAEHPETIDYNAAGGVIACPSMYGYLDDPEDCLSDNKYTCFECWNREIPNSTYAQTTSAQPTIKDSGNRTEFATGAVRDMREGKGRCDLMPLEVASHYLRNTRANKDDQVLALIRIFQKTNDTEALYLALDEFNLYHGWDCVDADDAKCTMLLEVAKHFEEGAKKYGENNWQKGIPVHCYIDSAVRHYLKWLRGDKDEPHDRAFVWNLMCCIWEVDYRKEVTT